MSKLKNMIIKHKLIFITFIFLFVLTGLRLIWFEVNEPPAHPSVERGSLDLRGWSLPDNKSIPLDGEWEFYPGKWIQPGGPEGGTEVKPAPGYISVPTPWNQSIRSTSSYGYATYRMKVWVSRIKEPYSLKINSIQTAARIYVNGELLKEAGHPASELSESLPRNYPYTVSFIPDQQEIEIIVQVSNFDYPDSGGIVESVRFGTESAVKHEQQFYARMQIAVYTILILHVLYAGILSLIGIRSQTHLFMSLAILSLVLSDLVDGSRWLLIWMPLTLEWSLKLSVIAYLSGTAFLGIGFKQLLPTAAQASVWKWVIYISVAAVILIPFLPLVVFLWLANFFRLLMVINIIRVIYLIFQFVSKQKDAGVFLLLTAVSIASFIFWTVVKYVFWHQMPYYPFDIIFAYLGFAGFWFIRFFQAHEQTQSWTRQLREADKQKDDYLTITSLELQAPLQGMIGMAGSILEERGTVMSARSRGDLELMIQVGQRMSLMLGDLLDIKRLNAQEIRLSRKSLSLSPVVTSVFDMLRFMNEGKKVEFVQGIPADFPHVDADENRLVQILFNLVHNALKFTNEGLIMVYADVEDSMVRIHVEDSGIGIDEDIQQIIFLPYEQGDSISTAALGGLGLGLSICRQLVHLHGGEITVRSSPGKGSVFTFTLPLG